MSDSTDWEHFHDGMCPAFIGDGECRCHVAYIHKLEADRDYYRKALVMAVDLLSELKHYIRPVPGGRLWAAIDDAVKVARSVLGIDGQTTPPSLDPPK
jgi:hypothetical protein